MLPSIYKFYFSPQTSRFRSQKPYLYCGAVEEFCEFRSAAKALCEVLEEEAENNEKKDVSSLAEESEAAARLGVLKELGDVTTL